MFAYNMVINVYLTEKYIQLSRTLFTSKRRKPKAGEAAVQAVLSTPGRPWPGWSAPRAEPRVRLRRLRPGRAREPHGTFALAVSPPCGLSLQTSALLINITTAVLLQTL